MACHRFAAALTGAAVCSTKLNAGPIVAYHAAMSIARRVWVSDGFVAENPLLCADFLRALSLPSCRWRLMASCQEALDYLGVNRAARQRELLLFVTAEEQAGMAMSVADNRICSDGLLLHPSVARIDEQRSCLGVCQL